MFFVPQGPDFQWVYSNTLTTRPSTAYGTSITPNTGVNTYGSWAQIASSANVTQDVYGIQICFNNNATSTQDRRTLVNVGVDNAGGTNYNILIPSLMAGKAIVYTSSPNGIWYYFPLYIKAGSSIALQATSTVTTAFNASVYLFGQPRRPDTLRVGAYVDAIGITTSTRQGTSLTLGTTSEGAWSSSLGTTSRRYWWWQLGVGMETASINNAILHFDLAVGNDTSKKLLLENQNWMSTSSEVIGNLPLISNCYNNVPAGQSIYGRGQSSGTPNTTSIVAYALGG